MTVGDTAGRWLPLTAPAGALPLYCLPHAGGGASAYRAWVGRLGGVAVMPVQLPGRDARLREAPYERMTPLVSALADVVPGAADGRYAVYGHSLGALVAFELLREIRRRGGPDPVHLFVSGCVPPQCRFDDGPPVRGMTQPQLVRTLRQLGGTPEWLLSDPSVLQMILPAVRADFSVKETYEYLPELPLDVPVTALASTHDPRAEHDLVGRWGEQTARTFERHTLVGGHFAVFEQATLTHRYVAEALRRWV